MSMTRAAIEAILRKHSRYEMDYQGHPTPLVCQVLPALVDDLLALVPTPSRETLEKILDRYWQLGLKRSDIVPVLMAWALGQPERRWCKHWMLYLPKDEWQPTPANPLADCANGAWTHCPYCGTPRPQ